MLIRLLICLPSALIVDLSIFRAGLGWGRTEKKFCYFGPKKSCP
jgi:hypothetical protein